MSNIGTAVENAGWLQGSIIDKCHADLIFAHAICIDLEPGSLTEEEYVFIVATQSCNLANNNAVNTVQLCIARKISEVKKDFAFNKHPRFLDIEYNELVGDVQSADVKTQPIRVNILEKVFVPKRILIDIEEFLGTPFFDTQLKIFVDWLGAHYTKPALPTSFNNQLKNLSKGQQRKHREKEKKLNHDFTGVYVKLSPNRELESGEQYDVQLLGVVSSTSDLTDAQQELDEYASYMTLVGMRVQAVAREATKVSIASLNGFNRIYLDDLSYGSNGELPIEVEVTGSTSV